jgi:CheY-like chemotaxis protein
MIRKFLLVDDDEDDTDLFYEALRDIDSSIEFHNGYDCQETIKKLKSGQINPQIIFLDINMPEMNGWDCLSVLKEDASLRNIPVIMYSTSSVNLDGKKAISKGAVCYLEKPPSFVKLKEFLERISLTPAENLRFELRRIQADNSHRLLVA